MTELECDILAGVRLKYGDTLAELARLTLDRIRAVEAKIATIEAAFSPESRSAGENSGHERATPE